MKAQYDSLSSIKFYSQHGEDNFLKELIQGNDKAKGIYIDVGANHPTSISNTYYLYRNGYNGLIVEPNVELANLHKRFRPKDRVFEIGIGSTPGVFEMNISKTPVLSSFNKIDEDLIEKKVYLPILTLDNLYISIKPGKVFFLSIDTEGMNVEVLKGATITLENTLYLCIEVDNEEDEKFINNFLVLNHNFKKIKSLGCNRFYINEKLKEDMI